MRASALCSPSTLQFKTLRVGNECVWKVTGVIGSRIGASKVNRGGWNGERDRPTELCIWNKDYLGGKLNLYQNVDDYLAARKTMECGTDRFFLAANPKGKTLATFFKRQHLGRNSFSRTIKEVQV